MAYINVFLSEITCIYEHFVKKCLYLLEKHAFLFKFQWKIPIFAHISLKMQLLIDISLKDAIIYSNNPYNHSNLLRMAYINAYYIEITCIYEYFLKKCLYLLEKHVFLYKYL